jgi:hypothetical protein
MKPNDSPLLEILSRDQLIETIPSGLFLVDCDQIIVQWNRDSNDNLKLTTCDNRILTTLSGERKAG